MPARLAGKRCLIVGGTGGIGAATARRFVEEGARVVVSGLPEEAPAAADTLPCDVKDSCQVARLFSDCQERLGGVDVLFHVAGISGRRHGDGALHECTDEGWRQTLDVNLTGTFLTNRAAVRVFLAQGRGGVILNMASVLAFSPSPQYFDAAAYAASKGGIISLTRLAAASYALHGIRVNALAPGLIDTPMARRAVDDPAIRAYLESKQPLARGPGAATDCAEAAVFLCSEEARLVTGVVLPVDGGWAVAQA